MKEDKRQILQKLLELLKCTRNLGRIKSLELEVFNSGWFGEYAVATFPDDEGVEKIYINISGDSGTAIINDVMRALYDKCI